MRITCPNCSAQYEIDASLIPPEGRDVQCSNCGTTWFQEGRAPAPTAAEVRAGRQAAPKSPTADATREQEPENSAMPEADRAPAAPAPAAPPASARPAAPSPSPPSPDDGSTDASEPARPQPGPSAPPRRAATDQRMLDILREERAREDRLRDSPTPETGPADAPPPRTAEAEPAEPSSAVVPPPPLRDARAVAADERARLAAAAIRARSRQTDRAPGEQVSAPRPASSDTPPEQGAAAIEAPQRGRPARRELLPDIEQINSSLRPDDRVVEADASRSGPVRRGGGFRSGFLATVIVLALPVLVYLSAEPLIRTVPGLAPQMERYVAWVDGRRNALDVWVEALTARLSQSG